MKDTLVGQPNWDWFVTESRVFEMGHSFLVNEDDPQKLIDFIKG